MTRDDVIKMLSLLKAAYPAFYSKMTPRDADNAISLWISMFSEDDPLVIAFAVKECIETHDGYPPSIAAIKNRAKQLIRIATNAPSVDELWSVFSKACENGIYSAKEEFEKLPPVLQRFAGSPRALSDYAMMDSKTFHSVVRGQFLKRVQEMQEQAEREAVMPAKVLEILRSTAQKMRAGIDEPVHDTNADRNRILDALEGDIG